MTTRAEQKEKRRMEILAAALEQFIRRGYAGTKIQDIADAAKMSVGLLFHYFESKEALYLALLTLGVSGPRGMLTEIPDVEPLAFFELCAQKTLEYAAQSDFTAKMFVLMGNAQFSQGIPEKAQEITAGLTFYRDMAPLIELGQKNGTIRQGNPLALCTAFWTSLQGCIEAYAKEPGLPLPEAQWIVDLIRSKNA